MPEPFTPLVLTRSLLGGTEETTLGTFPTITTALAATNIFDARLDLDDCTSAGRRNPIGPAGGSVAAIPGAKLGRLNFTQHVAYGDKFLALLTGCGMRLDTATYKPNRNAANWKSWGFKNWEDGRVKAIAGAAGNMVLTIASGAPLSAAFDFMGVWQTIVGEALPSQTPVVALPWLGDTVTLTLNGAAVPLWSTITIDLGAQVAVRPDASKGNPVLHCYIQSLRPTISIDFESRLESQFSNYALLEAATEHAFSCAISDGTHILTIAAPKAQRMQIAKGARDGLIVDNLTLECNVNAGEDELTFTAT